MATLFAEDGVIGMDDKTSDPSSPAGVGIYYSKNGTPFYRPPSSGTPVDLSPSASASPGGSNNHVQFNNSGSFGGSSDFQFDNGRVGIGGAASGTVDRLLKLQRGGQLNIRMQNNTDGVTTLLICGTGAGQLITETAHDLHFGTGSSIHWVIDDSAGGDLDSNGSRNIDVGGGNLNAVETINGNTELLLDAPSGFRTRDSGINVLSGTSAGVFVHSNFLRLNGNPIDNVRYLELQDGTNPGTPATGEAALFVGDSNPDVLNIKWDDGTVETIITQ